MWFQVVDTWDGKEGTMPNLHLKLLGGQHRVWALKTLADDEENKTLQVRSLLRASCHHSRLVFSQVSPLAALLQFEVPSMFYGKLEKVEWGNMSWALDQEGARYGRELKDVMLQLGTRSFVTEYVFGRSISRLPAHPLIVLDFDREKKLPTAEEAKTRFPGIQCGGESRSCLNCDLHNY
jgi:hypothetical protein